MSAPIARALLLGACLALSPAPVAAQDWAASAATAQPAPEQRLPLGNPHAGIQLEGGVGLFVPGLVTGGHVAAAVTLDIVLGLRETFRLAFFGESTTGSALEVVSTGVRFLFGFDLGAATIRIGGECGPNVSIGSSRDVSWVAIGPNAQARLEIAGRALDDRNLELGVAAHGGLDGGLVVFFDAFVGWVFE